MWILSQKLMPISRRQMAHLAAGWRQCNSWLRVLRGPPFVGSHRAAQSSAGSWTWVSPRAAEFVMVEPQAGVQKPKSVLDRSWVLHKSWTDPPGLLTNMSRVYDAGQWQRVVVRTGWRPQWLALRFGSSKGVSGKRNLAQGPGEACHDSGREKSE